MILFIPVQAFSQSSFPDGTTAGRTDADPNRQAGRIPFIDFSIREPSTNKDVAFSVQLLIFITLISPFSFSKELTSAFAVSVEVSTFTPVSIAFLLIINPSFFYYFSTIIKIYFVYLQP